MAEKSFWESQLFGIIAGALIAGLTGIGTSWFTSSTQVQIAKMTADTQLETTRIQGQTQLKVATQAAARERHERRKATVRDFVLACAELAIANQEGGLTKTDAEWAKAYRRVQLKTAKHLAALGAVSAEFPDAAVAPLLPESPAMLGARPKGAKRPTKAEIADSKIRLREGAAKFIVSCQKITNRLLIAIRNEAAQLRAEHGEAPLECGP